ncbi:hypothetical protein BDR03DRAFT_939249, partial [Suillus americanus]
MAAHKTWLNMSRSMVCVVGVLQRRSIALMEQPGAQSWSRCPSCAVLCLSFSAIDGYSGLRSPTKVELEDWFRGSKSCTNTCKFEDPR